MAVQHRGVEAEGAAEEPELNAGAFEAEASSRVDPDTAAPLEEVHTLVVRCPP